MQFGSLQEVIADHVHDGQSVALEGFTHLIPFAAGHEILRQRRRNLHLIRMTPDLIYDQLIGAGCARELTFSWGGNPDPGAGPTVVITDLGVLKPAAETNELTLVARYEDVTVEKIRAATGWPLAVADTVEVIPPPTAEELRVLRDLHARTRVAHAADVLPARKKPSPAPIGNHAHA